MPNRVSTAVVLADGVATTYRRCGSGRTVMVLGASEGVALALGTSFRIIVPEVPSPPLSDAAAARWLGGVCEGLGILEVAIVATPALRNAATRFAQDAPDRVKGIIIVDSGTTDAAEFRAAVERIFS